ncbi:MAG TPA: hypothetical protein VIM57_05110 [Luteolibacter sp.]
MATNHAQNQVVTTILDPYGSRQWRSCGKLWAASLLRHQWGGKIQINRNFPQPLFAVERADLHETSLVVLQNIGKSKEIDWKAHSRICQLDAAANLSSADDSPWVLLADADCVALRNLDHLFDSNCDILVSIANGSPDPGFVAVRGPLLSTFIKEVRAAGGLTKAGLASVLCSGAWKVGQFERGEVLRPDDPGISVFDLANAAVIHLAGTTVADRHRVAFAFHMMAVYQDQDGLFMDIMDA